MNITIGTWIIPAIVSVALGFWGWTKRDDPYLEYMMYGFVIILILVTWVIWLTLRLWGFA